MFGRTIVLLLLLSAAQQRGSAGTQNNAALWRPRFVNPAFVALDHKVDREFTIEMKGLAQARDWKVSVFNDFQVWNCELVSATFSRINRDTEPGWSVRARIPANAPPELLDLRVCNSEGVGIQKKAVNVVTSFRSDFYILHVSDEQIVNELHTDPSGQFWHMVGTWEEIKWMQQPINLIHPRFVLVTGDQIDFNGALDAWNNWDNWGYRPSGKKVFTREETLALERRLSGLYKDCHQGFQVAYVEAPGNHDVAPENKVLAGSNIHWHDISAGIYETEFGQRSFSFRMGDFYVLMHDWTDSVLKPWAAADYAASVADPTVTFRLIGQHFNTDQAFLPNRCDLMLVGHGHTTATLQSSPYYIYEDGPTFMYGRAGFFNFRRETNGWTCLQTVRPRDQVKDTWPLFTANGAVKKVRCSEPDPMNLETNVVSITNDLPEEFYDGRLRFVLPPHDYQSVENGTISAQYSCRDGTKTVLLVKVVIPANGTITVRVPEPGLGFERAQPGHEVQRAANGPR